MKNNQTIRLDGLTPFSQDEYTAPIHVNLKSLADDTLLTTRYFRSFDPSAVKKEVYIDAGIEHLHLNTYQSVDGRSDALTNDIVIKNNDDLATILKTRPLTSLVNDSTNGVKPSIYVTGKLADITRDRLGRGDTFAPSAVLWAAAKYHHGRFADQKMNTLAIVDLSASGYMVICINKDQNLKDDLLIVNPRCGAGTGINLNRILEKLDIGREEVDRILSDYLGEKGESKRRAVPTRSDRCGVFSSSATISDKNQGIPLDYALAVTLKSEVIKPCAKVPAGTDMVFLTGGVFRWQYARDCAGDLLLQKGVKTMRFDEYQSMNLSGMKFLVDSIGINNIRRQNGALLRKKTALLELPAFSNLKKEYENQGLYLRLPEADIPELTPDKLGKIPINIGLDIGSTMAKIVVSDAKTNEILYFDSYDNHGDTIQTIQHIFAEFKTRGIQRLKIQNIGITGSGRYQVQKALKAVYPHLSDRISVLVENYAHARGSIKFARQHINDLKKRGVSEMNEDFYVLVDIGGEDTKVSVISLKKGDLFDNAMNVKCSAGTGSLMDTLKALFSISDIGDAYRMAQSAEKAYGINATCAVFLMENARRMQASGYCKEEILASCCHAIVENMARSLWDQVEFPDHTLIVLHGQTMRSDPLPLAVTHRAQDYLGQKTHCLVPPLPGHRACIGLIECMDEQQEGIADFCHLDDLLERDFEKRIIICRGVACGDKNARCARTRLVSHDADKKIVLTLGGCTAINELQARRDDSEKIVVPDSYKGIWDFIDKQHPKTENPNRLIIPRSFCVSERAFFLAKLFERLGVPVHVDNVRESDVLQGQPFFSIDTCAPNIGATGQFIRLANEAHGVILVPQIDFLPTEGKSLGRTCTTNQGGVIIAKHFGKNANPKAKFVHFTLSLNKTDPEYIASQLYSAFTPILREYGKDVEPHEFLQAVIFASNEEKKLRAQVQELAADYIEEAVRQNLTISIVCGREYILNPGIYDSHVGKLLHDKNVVAIPSFAFETTLDEQYGYMYWKNPHDIMTKVTAISKKQLHTVVKNDRLKYLFKTIENDSDSLISTVIVSTFRCGPDTVSLPTLTQVAHNTPTLLIQSDAMIAELAHLENRVNTHLNQLEKKLHTELISETEFSIELLSEYNLDTLRKDKDVLYFPTLADNRVLTSVFKAAGITAIENFDDHSFNLEEKTKRGRAYMGDAVCTPLAAVFSDMLDAIHDFRARQKAGDPLVKGKDRLVLFMVGGDGPCRLGQYVDSIKVQFAKMFGPSVKKSTDIDKSFKILNNINSSLLSSGDHSEALEKWTAVLSFQGLILQGLLYSIFLRGGSMCRSADEFENFSRDFFKLKDNIYDHITNDISPGSFSKFIVDQVEKRVPKLTGVAYYFGYGLYNNNGLRTLLAHFSKKWIKGRGGDSDVQKKVRIHLDGEVYMRVTQSVQVFETIVDALGFGEFQLTHTPMWCFLENVLYARILTAENEIKTYQNSKEFSPGSRKDTDTLIEEKQAIIRKTHKSIRNLRDILASPMYKAAGIPMPHAMEDVFAKARPVLPTLKPYGELVPFVGEAMLQLGEGVDLFLNAAPEGCMVSSMGEILSPEILKSAPQKARVQQLFSTEGEVDEDVLRLALLKVMGPEKYYAASCGE